MHHRKTYMHINIQQIRVSRSVKTVHTNLFAKNASCINLQLPIIILKKSDLLDMHHHNTYMYINFEQNQEKTQVMTARTIFCSQKKIASCINLHLPIFFFNRLFQTCIIVKRTCISIFSKIGLEDQSKPCTQIYLQKIANCINL